MSLPKPHGGVLVSAYEPNYDATAIEKTILLDAVATVTWSSLASACSAP